jgi:hypothetical protein
MAMAEGTVLATVRFCSHEVCAAAHTTKGTRRTAVRDGKILAEKNTVMLGKDSSDSGPCRLLVRSVQMRSFSVFIALALLSAVAVTANTCGGNCPSNDCSSCPCGTSTAFVNIDQWCAKFGGWNQACCRCIVSHESSGNAHAINQNVGGSLDVGLIHRTGLVGK